MSANTSITEGGKGYTFGQVKCLMVEGDNGEFYPWYPEADRALDSLSVTQNGIYRASDRGVYGWNRVSVNVAQTDRVTGRDPDTGDEKTVTVDPETGELVETVVPVEIRIETPPTFTGPYGNGAYIDFTGLTVAAYGANGDKMLDVPFNELIFPVTVTDASAVVVGKGTKTLNGKSVEVARVYTIRQDCKAGGEWVLNMSVTNSCSAGVLIIYVGGLRAVSDVYDGSVHYQYSQDGEYWYAQELRGKTGFNGTTETLGNSIVTGEPMYAGEVEGRDRVGDDIAWKRYDTPTLQQSPYSPAETADIALHGEGNIEGGQQIPVQWQCPGSGEILETSFYIEVVNVSPNNAGN